MKKILFALVLSAAVYLPCAQADDSVPYLGSISTEITNQLTIASNNVVENKKLIKTLQGALKTIAKTKTNYVAGAKTLATLNKTFARTSLSNDFSILIEATATLYVNVFEDSLDDLEDRLDAAFPGKANEAARKALAKFEAAIQNANTNANFLLALKALGVAAKAEIAADKATDKAEDAPAPPNGFTANINTSDEHFTFNPKPIFVNAGYTAGTKILNLAVAEIKPGSVIQTRTFNLLLSVPNEGLNTYNLSTSPNVFVCTYGSYRTSFSNPNPVGESYSADSGSISLTINTTTRLVYGTFNFTGNGDDNGSKTGTISGSFSITYLQ